MMRRDPPLRVLVVDDDGEAADELAELLEAHGAAAWTAATPAEALQIAADKAPDIALLDLELGTTTSIELALHWHGHPATPTVILLSGRDLTPAEADQFRTIPPLMRKPIDVELMLAVINNRHC